MLQFMCKCLWYFCEEFNIRCPFAPWVFGKMIGAKSWKRIDKDKP